MNEFRKEFIADAPILFGDIKTSLMDSNDVYFMESQYAYEWATLVQPFLDVYLDVEKSASTKPALHKILDAGVEKLGRNQKKLEESLRSMDSMSEKIIKLRSKFNIRFDENRRLVIFKLRGYRAEDKGGPNGPLEKKLVPAIAEKMQAIKQFGSDAMRKIEQDILDIGDQQTKLMDEMQNIVNLKTAIYPILTMMDSDFDPGTNNELKTYAQDLLAESKKYCQRHNDKIKSL